MRTVGSSEGCDVVNECGIPCRSLRHRHHGPLMYVDLKIAVPATMTASEMMAVGAGEW